MTKYRNCSSQVSSSHLGPRLCFLVRNRTSFSSEDGSLFLWLASWFFFSSAGRTPKKRLRRASFLVKTRKVNCCCNHNHRNRACEGEAIAALSETDPTHVHFKRWFKEFIGLHQGMLFSQMLMAWSYISLKRRSCSRIRQGTWPRLF